MNYHTAAEIEFAIATQYFNTRQNLIVPNVSWGLGLHECDLLVLTTAGYAYEVEIKVSKADLVKDKLKKHGHSSNSIKKLYFAIPAKLAKHIEHIPRHAGVIVVTTTGLCRLIAEAEMNKHAPKFSDAERLQLARLGALRIWGMKEKLLNQKAHIAGLKKKIADLETHLALDTSA